MRLIDVTFIVHNVRIIAALQSPLIISNQNLLNMLK